jgi:HSP20 family protein
MNTDTSVQTKEAAAPTPDLTVLRPQVDIYENSEEFLIDVEMVGVKKKDIAIDLENNVLSLSGVRHYESKGDIRYQEFAGVEYRNSFSIPETIEVTQVKAKLDAGILHLILPKVDAVKPRVITVH